ncbi:MAG: DMT family transporter [Defluviitaleaceae bacterium]|nr:DMT family transporter [Defluviitaleaceae bacterium]
MNNQQKAYISAFITVVFWASAFPAVKFCLEYYSPGALMLFRFLIASAVLGVYCAAAKVKRPDKQDMPRFVLAGAVGIFVYMWLFNAGTSYVTAGLSSFIIGACPLGTLLLSIFVLKERAGLLGWVGIIVSFAGLALVASTGISGATVNIGVVMLLGAVACNSIYNIMQRGLTINRGYTAIAATSYSVFFATALMLVFVPQLLREFPSAPLAVNLVCIYLGVFPAAISYFCWGWALSRAEKTIHVASFLYLSPFIAATLSFLWLGERLEPIVAIGGVVIIAGMVLANIRKPVSNPATSQD